MKKALPCFLVILVIAISAVSAFSQTTRIKFARDATRKVVSGTLTGFKGQKTFVIRVRKGQKLTTEPLGNHSITVMIEGPPGSNYEQDMAADCHGRNEIESTDAGDYKFTITECQKADRWKGTFNMRVTVR